MNETIGVKGGKNDRRRRLIITKQFKEKLEAYQQEQHEKEIQELEKRVKQQQRITFIKVFPIAVAGQIYTTLTEDNEKKKELALNEVIDLIQKENMFSERETREIITALRNGTLYSLDNELLGKLGIPLEGYKRVSEIDLTDFVKEEKVVQENTIPEEKQVVSEETKSAVLKVVELTNQEEQHKEETLQQVSSATPEEQIQAGITATDTIDEQLDKLKNHKIVDEYENKLKEVRKELRTLIFEYNLIADAAENVYNSKEAEELLDRLNEIIRKMEELKKAIAVPDIDKYDDNYLYTLIESYIEEFKNKNFVSEIKDSSLYIMISDKLAELDSKKDKLQDKLETKKETLEIDEERLEELRERYFNYEKFNNDLLNFQATQDKVLDEIRDKMAKATTVTERVEAQLAGMTRQSRRLRNMIAASMLLPGARSARGIATMTATYLYFMRNVMNPRTVTRRYKVVKTTDYHKEIERSISQLDDVHSLLKKTSRQIDLTIKEVEKEFAEYIDVIPECKELLANLEKVKEEIKEKEYELQRIKEEQEKNLEKNNAKVLTLNYETPV